MIRRVPPPRYQSGDGRLVDYDASFEATEAFPTNIWTFSLAKTYIPWDTWEAFWEGGAPRMPATPPNLVRGTFALKTLGGEHERTLESVTQRLQEETDVVRQQGWTFFAYQRHFRYLAPALVNAFNDILPWLKDADAYHWPEVRDSLVGALEGGVLEYPLLADPAYFESHRLEALNLWETLDCISQVMAAKWELGFGECQNNPDPNEFRLPDLDPAIEVGGWMLNHYPSLRNGGPLPMPLTRFVDQHRSRLQPQYGADNVQELADRFGSAAVPDLFGDAWSRRFGYEALLTDLESALATPQQLIGLGWLFEQRLMR